MGPTSPAHMYTGASTHEAGGRTAPEGRPYDRLTRPARTKYHTMLIRTCFAPTLNIPRCTLNVTPLTAPLAL